MGNTPRRAVTPDMAKPRPTEDLHETRDIRGVGKLSVVGSTSAPRFAITLAGSEKRVKLRGVRSLVRSALAPPSATVSAAEFQRWLATRGRAVPASDVELYQRQRAANRDLNMERGSGVHRLVDLWVDGRLARASVPVEHRPFVAAFLEWADESGVRPVPGTANRLTCHPELLYAGRIDCHVHDESSGEDLLLELKTKNDSELSDPLLGMTDHLQLAFLMHAEQRCHAPCDRGLIVYLDQSAGHMAVACEADAEMVAAAAAWAPLRDRLRSHLRTKRVQRQTAKTIAETHWTMWVDDPEDEHEPDDRLPSERYSADGVPPEEPDEFLHEDD